MAYSKDVANYPIWMHELLTSTDLPLSIRYPTSREANNTRFRIYAFAAAMRHQFPGPRADSASALTVRLEKNLDGTTTLTVYNRDDMPDPLRDALRAKQQARADASSAITTETPQPPRMPTHEEIIEQYMRDASAGAPDKEPGDNSK